MHASLVHASLVHAGEATDVMSAFASIELEQRL